MYSILLPSNFYVFIKYIFKVGELHHIIKNWSEIKTKYLYGYWWNKLSFFWNINWHSASVVRFVSSQVTLFQHIHLCLCPQNTRKKLLPLLSLSHPKYFFLSPSADILCALLWPHANRKTSIIREERIGFPP